MTIKSVRGFATAQIMEHEDRTGAYLQIQILAPSSFFLLEGKHIRTSQGIQKLEQTISDLQKILEIAKEWQLKYAPAPEKKSLRDRAAYVEINTWRGLAIGAIHWYANIVYHTQEKMHNLPITCPLTAKQAESLNGNVHGYHSYKAGDLYAGFATKEAAMRRAIRMFPELVQDRDILVLGRSTIAEPQTILIGPDDIKDKINAWVERREGLSKYEVVEDEEILDEFHEFWNGYEEEE